MFKCELGDKKLENLSILGQGIHDPASKGWRKSMNIVLSRLTSFLS